MVDLVNLPYLEDSAGYFECVRALGWGIWLDSGKPHQNRGRYDIISAAPDKQLVSDHTGSYCIEGKHRRDYSSAWESLRQELVLDSIAPAPEDSLPFYHGALGYLGYDLGRQLEMLHDSTTDDSGLPELAIGIYGWALLQDHRERRSWFSCRPGFDQVRKAELLERLQNAQTESSRIDVSNQFKVGQFQSNTERDEYLVRISRIHEYIIAGDCYQVNFAQRFEADCKGDPFSGYLNLRHSLPSPYSAYFEAGDNTILSFSPEQFLQSDGRRVTTRPIKGTCPRGKNGEEDRALARQLQMSAKNRAENLMIVDLLRNDLSKVCKSVETPQLFALESYANVHHLVSTVTGVLEEPNDCIDLLRACFPGGSITGAPKRRAMQIIEELEKSRRSVYCGSLGYIDSTGRMDTSIAIRTLAVCRQKVYTWGGGGIVFDSDPEEEYQESLTKIGVLLRTLAQGNSWQ